MTTTELAEIRTELARLGREVRRYRHGAAVAAVEPRAITVPSGIWWRQPGETVASNDHNLTAGQGVMRFAIAAARSAALPAPVKNMVTLRDDAPGLLEYWNGTAWAALGDARFVNVSGDVMTGPLTVTDLVIDDVQASYRTLDIMSSGVSRWQMRANSTPETGLNTGSNLEFSARKDDGSQNMVALNVNRASGLMAVIGDPVTPLGVATKQYVDRDTGWIASGFTPGPSWTLPTPCQYRLFGKLCFLLIRAQRSGATLGPAPATGNITDELIVTVPPEIRIGVSTYTAVKGTSTSGCGVLASSAGDFKLADMHPTSTIANGENVSAFLVYPLD